MAAKKVSQYTTGSFKHRDESACYYFEHSHAHSVASCANNLDLYTDHYDLTFFVEPLFRVSEIDFFVTCIVLCWNKMWSAYKCLCLHVGGVNKIWTDLSSIYMFCQQYVILWQPFHFWRRLRTLSNWCLTPSSNCQQSIFPPGCLNGGMKTVFEICHHKLDDSLSTASICSPVSA